jgi:hypothetical protein
MAGAVIYLFLIFFVIVRVLNAKKPNSSGTGRTTGRTPSGKTVSNTASRKKAGRPFAKGPMASDGHRVPKDQDISCRRFGHKHEEFDTPRFIPHDDLEEGYIILNGVRMKLTEADSYENRI